MDKATYNQIYQDLAELNKQIFEIEVPKEDFSILNISYPTSEADISVIGYLCDSVLTEIMKIGKEESIFGPAVDLLMVYIAELAEVIKKDGHTYSKTRIALLVPESPFGQSRRDEEYQRSRFSPVEGPSDEDLERLNISLKYAVIDLSQNMDIENLFDQILDLYLK